MPINIVTTEKHLQLYEPYINNSLPTRKNLKWGINELNGEYRPVQNAPFVLTPKRYSMLSREVNLTLIALLGGTIQFLNFSRRLYNLQAVLTCSLIYLISKTPQSLLVTPFVQICHWHPWISHCCTLSSSLLAMSPTFIAKFYERTTNTKNW